LKEFKRGNTFHAKAQRKYAKPQRVAKKKYISRKGAKKNTFLLCGFASLCGFA
jgi:hypothetical protein